MPREGRPPPPASKQASKQASKWRPNSRWTSKFPLVSSTLAIRADKRRPYSMDFRFLARFFYYDFFKTFIGLSTSWCRKTKATINGFPFFCTVLLLRLCQDLLLADQVAVRKNEGHIQGISVFCTLLLLRLCQDLLLADQVAVRKNEDHIQGISFFCTVFLTLRK